MQISCWRHIAVCLALVSSFALTGEPAVELKWVGKENVVNHHLDVPYHILEKKWTFDATKSGEAESLPLQKKNEPSDSGNMIIHGDNLLALKSLLPKYEGKVKCIYIDPPYNTGNEGWCYNDNVNDPRIKKWLGEVVGKEGEDFTRHDKWLCMMYPRLKLLQKLLAKDGVIFISIDDNEQANLRFICDEIFGSRNFVATFTWKSRAKPANTGEAKYKPQNDAEYVLCYKGNGKPPYLHVMSGKERSYPHHDQDGNYRLQTILKSNRGESKRDTMTFGLDGYFPPPSKRWQAGEDTIKDLYARNRITFETGEPMLKYYEHEEKEEIAPFYCHILKEISGSAESGKTCLNHILGNTHGFDTVKPVELLKYLFSHTVSDNDVVLDTFAGSGTTAHAVLEMNKEDNKNRRFILVEMCDYADTITAQRVKTVANGYSYEQKKKVVQVAGTGGAFSYYELGEPLMQGELLNPKAGETAIREFVWYSETKTAMGENCRRGDDSTGERTYLGTNNGTAYYFFYEPDKVTELNRATVRRVKHEADDYIVYADVCALSAAELKRRHITFKKIPRDIASK